ncbi:MAG TPA: DUF4214 domain-containing protein [Pyrinomonadaceae bacterium]|jgi:hypothetical protein|nr:DUF4214 domain-containing protein [Pyrinomonadaceae bacterium]
MRTSLRFLLLFFIGVVACTVSPAQTQSSNDEAYFEFSVSPQPDTFVFKLTNPARIQEARDILTTGNQKVVLGTIIKQPVYYNSQWNFHYDPQTVSFVDFAIELCESSIRGIEDNLDTAYPAWCPGAQLLREVAPPPVPGPGNLAPTVSITFPYADDTYSNVEPASISLKANADDADGTISKVEFFNGETKIGETTETPYMLDWINLAAGTYTVSAVATDNLGAARRSKGISFTFEQSNSGNVIDDTQFFVSQHYRDFFSREPDAAGQHFWADNISSCGADEECREVKRIDTSAAYFLSIEFQETGYLVHRFYKASFNRRPLFAEFLADTQTIGNGVVVNVPGWQQRLDNNKESFTSEWVARAEFASLYDEMNDAQYVDALIENTGTSFTETDRDALVDVLNNQAMTRAQVLRVIAESQAFCDAEYNAAFVEMQYFGYLRRNPQDAPDNDLDGYNFWLNKLNEFGGDFRRAEMVKAFLVSGEYRQRFGAQ